VSPWGGAWHIERKKIIKLKCNNSVGLNLGSSIKERNKNISKKREKRKVRGKRSVQKMMNKIHVWVIGSKKSFKLGTKTLEHRGPDQSFAKRSGVWG
jgi:hypothetical protein